MSMTIVPIDQEEKLSLKQWKRIKWRVGLTRNHIPDKYDLCSAMCSEASKYGIVISFIEVGL
jgi:hypothetical protein